jgi:ubiquinone/menaquinone biosynthesis C-methylase UbiE
MERSHIPRFDRPVLRMEPSGGAMVHCLTAPSDRQDERLLKGFAREWERFPEMDPAELDLVARELFDLLPDRPGSDGMMVDIGCGSGRWTRWLAPRHAHVDAVDPGDAVLTAARVNADLANVRWSRARGEDLPFPSDSYDLALCIGVLHHVADPVRVLSEACRVLRPGGMLYFYIYHSMEDRGGIFKGLYRISDLLRRLIHPMPYPLGYACSQVLATTVYLPLVSLVRVAKRLGLKGWHRLPLSFYHNKSFRIMRNDALDRFGTPVEKRFDRLSIKAMLEKAGLHLEDISEQAPYWHGTARKRTAHPGSSRTTEGSSSSSHT